MVRGIPQGLTQADISGDTELIHKANDGVETRTLHHKEVIPVIPFSRSMEVFQGSWEATDPKSTKCLKAAQTLVIIAMSSFHHDLR